MNKLYQLFGNIKNAKEESFVCEKCCMNKVFYAKEVSFGIVISEQFAKEM